MSLLWFLRRCSLAAQSKTLHFTPYSDILSYILDKDFDITIHPIEVIFHTLFSSAHNCHNYKHSCSPVEQISNRELLLQCFLKITRALYPLTTVYSRLHRALTQAWKWARARLLTEELSASVFLGNQSCCGYRWEIEMTHPLVLYTPNAYVTWSYCIIWTYWTEGLNNSRMTYYLTAIHLYEHVYFITLCNCLQCGAAFQYFYVPGVVYIIINYNTLVEPFQVFLFFNLIWIWIWVLK